MVRLSPEDEERHRKEAEESFKQADRLKLRIAPSRLYVQHVLPFVFGLILEFLLFSCGFDGGFVLNEYQ